MAYFQAGKKGFGEEIFALAFMRGQLYRGVSVKGGFLMGGMGVTEILIIAGVVVLLFGAKKIPELAKGIGQGLNIFKKEVHQGSDEGSQDKT